MTAEYTCPMCQTTLRVDHRDDAPYRPFCSKRCQMRDLNKWFNEEYRISSAPPDPDEPASPNRN